MKKKEIQKLTLDQLKETLIKSKKDLFNIRFRKVNGQIEDPSQILKTRRDVAKILTKLNKQNKKI